ncbi:MAG: hypothetical protein H0X66_16095 [Verrucomicrobia bacterium]|nr:hypothetical protein [Verrucomicrobiota bacterium]
MKRFLPLVAVSWFVLVAGCDSETKSIQSVVDLPLATVVDAACGRCMFALKDGKKCNLAIRTDGKSYFVDGFTMRQFGNPDIASGMCKKVHQATVTGQIANGRFAASTFELLPLAKN